MIKNVSGFLPRPLAPSQASRSLKFTVRRYNDRAAGIPPGVSSLYDGSRETENCGVGMVASLHKVPSRKVFENADEMLVRMSHRGGCGCDPRSGDGAGVLVGMPDSFMRSVALSAWGADLPPLGDYCVGNVFFPNDRGKVARAKKILEDTVRRSGLGVLGWRKVPVDNSMLGKDPIDSEPITEQIFIVNDGKARGGGRRGSAMDQRKFERELMRIRKLSEDECMAAGLEGFYINSLTGQTITYKGQLTPAQVTQYFLDLKNPDFITHMALVHSRFSTNTFPSWSRAQPIRMMCHNGEINTLRGNKNWMYSRGGIMCSDYFGDDTSQLLPATSDNMSDSGNFDSVLELLTKASERSLPESIMMMIPEAWQDNKNLSETKKNFYEFNSNIMEPWDGPAMVAFTDGRYIGATLDRNGLRPSRYYVTKDDHVMLSSEIGVCPEICDSEVKIKHRLEPGKMFLVDFDTARIIPDNEIKEKIASRKPYGDWLREGSIDLEAWAEGTKTDKFNFNTTSRRLNMFGYSSETLDMLLLPMAIGGKEALGSMGNDAALAVLSECPRQPSDYFKQLFAQVTNPPIDPIREELVMSLMCPVGREGNMLAEPGKDHCSRLIVRQPVMTLGEMKTVKNQAYHRNGKDVFSTNVIDCTFPVGSGASGMLEALDRICDEASQAIQGDLGVDGVQGVVLSDKLAGPDRMPLPSLIAVGAVHQHLLSTKQRPKAAIFAECGDAREVHDFATMFGFGCDGVCPYVAYEALCKMNHDGVVNAKTKEPFTDDELMQAYRNSAAKGLLKVMSKMGISTLQSYKGAQVFEAVGLAEEIVDRCFTGTTTRIQGTDFDSLYDDLQRFHESAYPPNDGEPLIQNYGQFHFRDGQEAHLNTPENMVDLQLASRTNSPDAYKRFAEITNKQTEKVALRGQLKFKAAKEKVPLEEVEPAASIVKRFVTGAMSLGSISQESHETLAKAMNELGGRSNTGEGGEDPKRFEDNRRSSIKQVASGRFGVTSNYLANSDQIQIKMAQVRARRGRCAAEGAKLIFSASECASDAGFLRRRHCV